MAILLKNLCEMKYCATIKPKGASSIETMGELASWLNRKVIEPIKNKMLPGEELAHKHEPILADGSTFHDKSGNIKVFVGMFPDKWRPRILGGVAHFLKQKNIETGKWELIGKEYQDDKRFVNIPLTFPEKSGEAPKIELTPGALQMIMDLLPIGPEYSKRGQFSFEIPASTLHDVIENYYELSDDGLSPKPQNAKIRGYIKDMLELSKWAMSHGITHIVAH